jgi:hypothetical protein
VAAWEDLKFIGATKIEVRDEARHLFTMDELAALGSILPLAR